MRRSYVQIPRLPRVEVVKLQRLSAFRVCFTFIVFDRFAAPSPLLALSSSSRVESKSWSHVFVALEPGHCEAAPDRGEVERGEAVEQGGGHGDGAGDADGLQARDIAGFGDADAARYGHEAGEQHDEGVNEDHLREVGVAAEGV